MPLIFSNIASRCGQCPCQTWAQLSLHFDSNTGGLFHCQQRRTECWWSAEAREEVRTGLLCSLHCSAARQLLLLSRDVARGGCCCLKKCCCGSGTFAEVSMWCTICLQQCQAISKPLCSCKLPMFGGVTLPVRGENVGKRCVGKSPLETVPDRLGAPMKCVAN